MVEHSYKKFIFFLVFKLKVTQVHTYPDFRLWQIGPSGYLLSGGHIWIPISGKQSFQFLQLLAREVCPLPPLSFILFFLVIFIQTISFQSSSGFAHTHPPIVTPGIVSQTPSGSAAVAMTHWVLRLFCVGIGVIRVIV